MRRRFQVELSLALGKTLAEIEAMPERHYRDYAAYYREQPFGLWRDDFRFAYGLATVAGMLGGKGQTPGDFMPFYRSTADPAALQQTIDDIFAGAVIVRTRADRFT